MAWDITANMKDAKPSFKSFLNMFQIIKWEAGTEIIRSFDHSIN